MAVVVKEVVKEKEEVKTAPKLEVSNDGPKCFNCGNLLEGTKCPKCGFDSSTLINYHDL